MSDNSPKSSFLDEQDDGGHQGLFARLRFYFLAGVFVTAPIGITIYLTLIFLNFVNNQVTSLIPPQYDPFNQLHALPGIELIKPLVSLIVVVAFFVVIGWFARNFLGRMIYRIFEYVVERMPVISSIYSATKQIFETIMASKSQAFKDVVVFEYPRQGVWTMGFVTGTALGDMQDLARGDELVSVFLPTCPSPTNGVLLFLPRKSLTVMDMTVEEGFKMVVSCGIVTPPEKDKQAKKS